MSWQSYVHIPPGGEWATNSCVFATKEEAEAAGSELLSRWFVPDAHEARETDKPVNYRFDHENFKSVPITS